MSDISCKILKNEKDIIVFDDDDVEHVKSAVFSILLGLFFLMTFSEDKVGWLFFVILIINGISLIISKHETITIDKKLKSVYIESRRLFVIKGKDRTIGFSEIIYPTIKYEEFWDIFLTLKSGEIKSIFRGNNDEEGEALFNKIFAFIRGDEVINFTYNASEDFTCRPHACLGDSSAPPLFGNLRLA